MTTLAIMQPYFFPYLGYWQLLHAADRVVLYDDVNYIKGGWINRNRLLIGGRPAYMTVPLRRPSSFTRICDLELAAAPAWRAKLVRMIELGYRRAPFFDAVFPVVAGAVQAPVSSLAAYLAQALHAVAALLGIETEIVASRGRYGNEHLAGAARVLDICRREGARTYLNLPGGRSLYDGAAFREAGVSLRFLQMRATPYRQRAPGFVPGLSIVDVLMETGPEATTARLGDCELLP